MKTLTLALFWFTVPVAALGAILFCMGITDVEGSLPQLFYGIALTAPIIVNYWLLDHCYSWGSERFYATLPEEATMRHFWNQTGIGIDGSRRMLYLSNGSHTAHYSFANVVEMESIPHPVADNAGRRIEGTPHSGLALSIRDSEHPVWRLLFKDDTEKRSWYTLVERAILSH